MFRLLLSLLGAVAILPVVGGCAGVRFDAVRSDAEDDRANGFRYYEPAVYLLAWSDGNGNVKTQVKVMPDQTRKMTAEPHAFWAKLKTELSFDRGMLTTTSTKGEAAAVPKAILDIVKEAAGAIAKAALTEADDAAAEGRVPAPLLFKVVPEGEPGNFTLYASEAVEPIRVTLPPKKQG